VLYRYALLQLGECHLADDAVQETLLIALQSLDRFQAKSALRTWLIGILKNKIADHWRRRQTEILTAEISQNPEDDNQTEQDFFMADGHWSSKPQTWSDPEAALKQQEFWVVYEACQNNLPATMANVFMLRELVGLETDEVCRETGISEANYWVTMHRARLRLRACLELRWFNHDKPEAGYAQL
jgi:RNA polymerase sigma-70 factor, ECF subfamily